MMNAFARDISHVFDNETEATLYMIADTETVEDYYVFSLPIHSFTLVVKNENEIELFLKYEKGFLNNPAIKEKMILEMKDMLRSHLNGDYLLKNGGYHDR